MNSSSTNQKIQAAIAFLVGIFLIFINPSLVTKTVNMFLKGITKGASMPMNPIGSLRLQVSFGWLGLTVIAGIVLLLVAYAFLKDKKWAFPVALTSLAILPVGSFYVSSFAGYMVKKGAFAPSFTAFIVGLVAFWAIILLEKKGKDLWPTFIPLTLLGMFGTQVFAFSEHGLRGLYQGGKTASILDPTIGILRYSQPIMFISLIFIFLAIYYLASKTEKGWWFSLVAGLGAAIAAFPVHFARPKASFSVAGADAFEKGAKVVGAGTPSMFTSVYFLGGLLATIFVIVMLIPYFKNYYMPKK